MENNEEIVAQAGLTECNFGGIEIGNVTSESLYWRRNWGEDSVTEWKEAEIKYSSTDNDGNRFEIDPELTDEFKPYFTTGNIDEAGNEWKYFLDEFMRYDRERV